MLVLSKPRTRLQHQRPSCAAGALRTCYRGDVGTGLRNLTSGFRSLTAKFGNRPAPWSSSSSVEPSGVRRKVHCRAASQSSAATDEVTVELRVPQYVTTLGQQLKVVGADPLLGSWDVWAAPSMTWQEGHTWTLELRLPVGQHAFKLAVTQGNRVVWESGEDRKVLIKHGVKLLGPEAKICVSCDFNVTNDTKMETKYDKAFLQARLNTAQKMVVSLTQRKLSLQKQLVTLLHQAQDSERTTKELVVEALATDTSSIAQLFPPPGGAQGVHSSGGSFMVDHHNKPPADFDMEPPHPDDASSADMETVDAEAIQRALSASLQQLTTESSEDAHQPSNSAHSEVQSTDAATETLTETQGMADNLDASHMQVNTHTQMSPRGNMPPNDVFQTIDIRRGLVGDVPPQSYASSVTASMHDELMHGFLSFQSLPGTEPTGPHIVVKYTPTLTSHAISVDTPEELEHVEVAPSQEEPDTALSCDKNVVLSPVDTPLSPPVVMASVEVPLADPTPSTPVVEDQSIWTDLMGMMVHSHFSHMLRLSSSLGRSQLLLLQLSVAITAASVGKGGQLLGSSHLSTPAKSTSQGFLASLSKAWAPISAMTRRFFPATTAALVGVVVVGWYAKVASAGVN